MHPRTRLMIAAVVIAAIATVASLAYVWSWVNRPGGGTPNSPAVQLALVQTGLAWPIALAFASDGRIFFAERNTGNIRIIEAGALLPTPFYTLTNTATAGERGLLGLALDPRFPSTPYVYAYQTYNDAANGTIYNRIVRLSANGNVGTFDSVILTMPPLSGATNHNGGVIPFGPDGKLWAVVGENAHPSLAPKPISLLREGLPMTSRRSSASDHPLYGTSSNDDRADECGVLHRYPAPAISESSDVRRVQRCATPGTGTLRGWDDRGERDDPVDGAFRDPRCRNGPGWLSVGDDLVRHLPSRRRTADDRGGSADRSGRRYRTSCRTRDSETQSATPLGPPVTVVRGPFQKP